MKRIAIAGFAHETNTFSPLPTRYEDFATRTGPFTGIVRWDEVKVMRGKRANDATLGFLNTLDQLGGYEPVYILSTSTNPSNQVELDAYNKITEMILSEIEAAGPVDGVYLDLHGAMVYEGYHSGETELVRRVKARLGDIPVVTSFDLHGNIPQACFELTTAMVGCRQYPHVDMYETGERVARLLHHHLQGKPLFKAFKRVPFIPVLSKTTTFEDPFKSIYASIDEAEKDPQVLCGTIMEGFPPSDTAHTGPTIFAYALTQQAADQAVEHMYNAFLSREPEIVSSLPKPAECVKQAIE
ncbi:MAG: M81 family metallopeptidase, partial [Anaerolineaceae bacterium]